MTTVPFVRLHEDAKMPKRGSNYAAGYDLFACGSGDIAIEPHKTVRIDTGIAVALPENTAGLVLPRSGLATKQGLRPANTPGLIDEDYRGSIIVAIHNDTDHLRYICPGDRIAQLMIIPYLAVEFKETKNLNETERGTGGFGSTGN